MLGESDTYGNNEYKCTCRRSQLELTMHINYQNPEPMFPLDNCPRGTFMGWTSIPHIYIVAPAF